MNLTSRRILQAISHGDYPRADALLADHGQLYGTGPERITWYRVGDDVLCRLSTSQIQWAGKLSSEPYFAPPVGMVMA